MLSKSIVRIIPALALLSALGMSNVAFANNQAKLALAKKAVFTGAISPYATPNFKKILRQANTINDRMAKTAEDEGMGCEFAEHFYLGWGNDPSEADIKRTWKASVTKSGMVRATFNNIGSANLVEFDMVCKGNSCQISDVRSGYSDNPKVFPKRTSGMSLKQEAQLMISKNSCSWE